MPSDLEWRRTLGKAGSQMRAAANLLLLHHMLLHFHFESGGLGAQGRSQTRIGLGWANDRLNNTLNSSLNQVFHFGAVLKAMTNQNWEIDRKGTESFRMCRSNVCKREVSVWLTPGSTLNCSRQNKLISPLCVISLREARFSKCFLKLDWRSILGISTEQHESSLWSISVESKVERE